MNYRKYLSNMSDIESIYIVWFYLYSKPTLTSLVSLVNINKWIVLMELKKTTYTFNTLVKIQHQY